MSGWFRQECKRGTETGSPAASPRGHLHFLQVAGEVSEQNCQAWGVQAQPCAIQVCARSLGDTTEWVHWHPPSGFLCEPPGRHREAVTGGLLGLGLPPVSGRGFHRCLGAMITGW